jgi:hypothetical protein
MLSIPLHTFSPNLNIPFVNLARKKRNHSLFRGFYAFPSILLLEVNPKRVSTALSSIATTILGSRSPSVLLSACMTNKV